MHHNHSVNTQVKGNRLLLSSPRELILLAPSLSAIPFSLSNIHSDRHRYEDLLSDMQAMRGDVYLQDGAIGPQQLTEGRHHQPQDERSWHLLAIDHRGRVCGCARYREYPNRTGFGQLGVARSGLAQCPQWGRRLQSCVNAELALARRIRLPYVELGGWALTRETRNTTEALRMALATYALAQSLGGGVGISTATCRNGSASILRRLGGAPLEHAFDELPGYFDPEYGCDMHILRFYSWNPTVRYWDRIAEMKRMLANVQVVTNGDWDPDWEFRQPKTAHHASSTLQILPLPAVHALCERVPMMDGMHEPRIVS